MRSSGTRPPCETRKLIQESYMDSSFQASGSLVYFIHRTPDDTPEAPGIQSQAMPYGL